MNFLVKRILVDSSIDEPSHGGENRWTNLRGTIAEDKLGRIWPVLACKVERFRSFREVTRETFRHGIPIETRTVCWILNGNASLPATFQGICSTWAANRDRNSNTFPTVLVASTRRSCSSPPDYNASVVGSCFTNCKLEALSRWISKFV